MTIPIGAATEVIAAEGKIVTRRDRHPHPLDLPAAGGRALVSGVTTADRRQVRRRAPTPPPVRRGRGISPACCRHRRCAVRVNIDLLGKGNGSNPAALREQIAAGTIRAEDPRRLGRHACGDQLLAGGGRRDGHSGGAAQRHAELVRVCRRYTLAAIGGRTIHTFHTEGAGGGHARISSPPARTRNILPSSTNPTLPYTVNTIDEHLDMLMVCHHLDPDIAEDVAFANPAFVVKPSPRKTCCTTSARFSLTSSDSQTHGPRWGSDYPHLAGRAPHEGSARRAAGKAGDNDNFRVKRYVAKYTINPALTHGIAHEVELD